MSSSSHHPPSNNKRIEEEPLQPVGNDTEALPDKPIRLMVIENPDDQK